MTNVLSDAQLKDARIVPNNLDNLVKSINDLNKDNLVALEVSEVLRAIGLIGVDEAKERKLSYGGWVPQEILIEKRKNGKYVAHFLDRNTSLIFKNSQSAYGIIMKTSWNIISDADVVGELADNDGLLHINYDEMPFYEKNNSYNSFLLNPSTPASKNTLRGKIQRNYFGKNEDIFNKNMNTLIKINDVIRTIYTPSDADIMTAFNQNPDAKAISRACWLGDFGNSSNVYANIRIVDSDSGLVFGVPSTAQSAGAKNSSINLSNMEDEIYSTLIKGKIESDQNETKKTLHDIVNKYQKQ